MGSFSPLNWGFSPIAKSPFFLYSSDCASTCVNESMTPRKLGKLPPRFDSRTLLLSKYITPALPPPPDSADYSTAIGTWPMMLNDNYGDCVVAAAGHMIQEWTANTGNEFIPPDSDIASAYTHWVGSATDQGISMLDFLLYWQTFGLAGRTIDSFTMLELGNNVQAQDSIYLFGNCYIGVALPDFAVKTDDPWDVPSSGPIGAAAPNPKNGHCIPAVAYDQRFLYVVTWGAIRKMSWRFYDSYADEVYAVLSTDWINKTLGTSPEGLDLSTLQKDLKAVTA